MSISSIINDAGSFHPGNVTVHSAVLRSNCCGHGIFQRNRRLHHLNLLAASVALFAATPAFAQDAAQDCTANPGDCVVSTASRRSDIVVTATGVEQPVEQIGQAVTVIERTEIERRQTVSISDLLGTTPGVTVTPQRRAGQFHRRAHSRCGGASRP